MTQEEKELLLKDLCGRLTHGVKCKYYDCCEDDYNEGTICGFERQEYIQIDGVCIHVEDVKPYLFPLSSMTEEQKEELIELIHPKDTAILAEILRKKAKGESVNGYGITHHAADWCNKNHFDYRGLIPMGLAVDASGLNIY